MVGQEGCKCNSIILVGEQFLLCLYNTRNGPCVMYDLSGCFYDLLTTHYGCTIGSTFRSSIHAQQRSLTDDPITRGGRRSYVTAWQRQLKITVCAGEERGFYCCIHDKKWSRVQQAWRQDFNFCWTLHYKS